MRLDNYLSRFEIGSRSQVLKIIINHRIKVNDRIITDPSFETSDHDMILFDDKPLKPIQFEYYLLNKPKGFYCVSNRNPNVLQLINSRNVKLFPVGRLDKETEGLILVTNDGKLNQKLLDPKQKIEKKYYLKSDVDLPYNAKELLLNPSKIRDYFPQPANYEMIDRRNGILTIHEGKYHEVRDLIRQIGGYVIELKRIQFSFLKLDYLQSGDYRKLTEEEIQRLKND